MSTEERYSLPPVIVSYNLSSILGWAEFCSWTAFALALIIDYLQGPAVSCEQGLVRVFVIGGTATTAVCLRGRLICQRFGLISWTPARLPRLSRSRACLIAAQALVALHISLLIGECFMLSPTSNEVAHLPAGVRCWQLGRFDLYPVNPPLAKMIAALPSVAMGARTDWTPLRSGVRVRSEAAVGEAFLRANGTAAFWYYSVARLALIPLSALVAWVSYSWARDLFGPLAGTLSVAAWCFCPNALAWGATITADTTAAAMGVLAAYLMWRWLTHPTWAGAFSAGLTLGLAQLSKTIWLVLYGLWPLLWLLILFPRRTAARAWRRLLYDLAQMAFIIVLSVYTLNLAYQFNGSFKPLKDYTFISNALAGQPFMDGGLGGNRFAPYFIGRIPVPLPSDYVVGIDLQKSDFEEGAWSYLNGQWKYGGWWYYYLEALLLKLPLGTLLLVLFAFVLALSCRFSRPWQRWQELSSGGRQRRRYMTSMLSTITEHPVRNLMTPYWRGWQNELMLLAPAISIFVLVSSQTGFSRHCRYILPCLPFILIWMSRVCDERRAGGRIMVAGVLILLEWTMVSSLFVYPHCLSYFNEVCGGPLRGGAYLLDSNIDWGQDLFFVRRWRDAHPSAVPLEIAVSGSPEVTRLAIGGHFMASMLGGFPNHAVQVVDATDVPGRKSTSADGPDEPQRWYAVSIHRLHEPHERHAALLDGYKPVRRIGYSILLYVLSADEARRLFDE